MKRWVAAGLSAAWLAGAAAPVHGQPPGPARGQAPAAEQSSAAGQVERPRGYVAGFAGLFAQPVGEVDGHYLTEGVGGSGFGFGATAGALVGRHWSIAAEVARGPQFSADSYFAGRIHYRTQYRDTLLSGLVRWHPLGAGGVSVEPLAGVTVAIGHAPRTAAWVRWDFTEEEPYDETVTRVSFGFGGGADLVVPAGRLAGVASFRLHVLDRNDQPPQLGVGRFVFVVAGGLRWTF